MPPKLPFPFVRLVIEKMKNKGILISTGGPYRKVLKVKPAIFFTRDNVDSFFIETSDLILKDFD